MRTAPHRCLACFLALATGGLFVAAPSPLPLSPEAGARGFSSPLAPASGERGRGEGTKPDSKVVTNSIGMKLAPIPAGKFKMGSPADEKERDDNESQHEVVITKPFYMGVYEVTQREYETLMGKAREGGKHNEWNHGQFFDAANGGSPD